MAQRPRREVVEYCFRCIAWYSVGFGLFSLCGYARSRRTQERLILVRDSKDVKRLQGPDTWNPEPGTRDCPDQMRYTAAPQSSTLSRMLLVPSKSSSCGANAKSKRPTGSGPSQQFQRTAWTVDLPSVIHSFACFLSS